MTKELCDIGLIGLGVMGGNFLLNIADHGFTVAGYDADIGKIRELKNEKEAGHKIQLPETLPGFFEILKRPRAIILLVPAGKTVDLVISEIIPFLDSGDLIIDSGNSHFTETDRRIRQLSEKNLFFIGMGISGGEYGARNGPSLMPGGSSEGYERARQILEAAAAKVNGEPCTAYIGAGSAGHYVKMVHNGIEYGIMQLIAETYEVMKLALEMSAQEIHSVYEQWNKTELNSYLLEITAEILNRCDEKTGHPIIDVILDQAEQKGTGMWMSENAMELQVPTPTIDMAVMMRDISAQKEKRKAISKNLQPPDHLFHGDKKEFIESLRNALYCGMVVTFAQGMELLKEASDNYKYGITMEIIAGIWRGGCIIRAGLLEDIRYAYKKEKDLINLLADYKISEGIKLRQHYLRHAVGICMQLGLPVPALAGTQCYIDVMSSTWLPANLIQAQRDFFGAHMYERTDAPGTYHTQWQ